MKVITALLALNLITGTVYHFMVVNELKSDLYVEQELFKACSAELTWQMMKLQDIVSQ